MNNKHALKLMADDFRQIITLHADGFTNYTNLFFLQIIVFHGYPACKTFCSLKIIKRILWHAFVLMLL